MKRGSNHECVQKNSKLGGNRRHLVQILISKEKFTRKYFRTQWSETNHGASSQLIQNYYRKKIYFFDVDFKERYSLPSMCFFSGPILFTIAAIVRTVCSFVSPVFFVLNFLTKSVVVIGLCERYLLIVASVITRGSLPLEDDASCLGFLL